MWDHDSGQDEQKGDKERMYPPQWITIIPQVKEVY